VVLGQHELLSGAAGSLRVRLADRHTGTVLSGVPVEIELRGGPGQVVRLANFTTDSQGTGQPRFQLPDWAEGRYELRITARPGSTGEVGAGQVRRARLWKLMLSSDKPVYQPGQTIHVRSLALRRTDLKPVADQNAVLSVSDPRGNIIFKQESKTSKYGI